MTHVFETVREKDHAVLECIRRGETDVYQINKATVEDFSRREINYAFKKLANTGLITVTTFPDDEYITVVDDGQPRTFSRPKEAELTELGEDYFDWKDSETGLGRYDAVEYPKLVDRVHTLEQQSETRDHRIQKLETRVTNGFAAIKKRLHTVNERLDQLEDAVDRLLAHVFRGRFDE